MRKIEPGPSTCAVVLVALASLGAGAPLGAQASADSMSPLPAPKLCFRGHPLPRCIAFLITEFGYGRAPRGETNPFDAPVVEPDLVFWELGLVRNLSTASALGGTFFLTSRFSMGLKAATAGGSAENSASMWPPASR